MPENETFLKVTLTGQDRPGIMAILTQVLIKHDAEMVEIEQSSLQNMLRCYFLLDLSGVTDSQDDVVKDLLFEASKLNLQLEYQELSSSQIRPLTQHHLIVLIHFGGTRVLAELSRILGEEKVTIETIKSLNHHDARSTEMFLNVEQVSDLARLKQRLMKKSRELNIDVALQKMEAYRRNKRLIFFDMDSTLIDTEIIDELAKRAGVYREVSRITDKAMRGDFDFEESLIQRVAMLKGLRIETLTQIRDEMRLSEGVEELTATLRWLGYRLGIVTGGFDFFFDHLKSQLNFDFAYGNQLEIMNGALTGRVLGKILDPAEKARIVDRKACDLKIPLDQVAAVGDGANDTLMLSQAGLGIAYNAKRGVDRIANAALARSRLRHIFHLLGITEEDIQEAMTCRAL
jgi:phosphoserine phosphatase